MLYSIVSLKFIRLLSYFKLQNVQG